MQWRWIIDAGFAISLIVNALLFIPQIIILWRKKSAENVSLITFLGFNVIQFFTFVHGLMLKDYILAIGFLLSIITCATVTSLIIYYRLKEKNVHVLAVNE